MVELDIKSRIFAPVAKEIDKVVENILGVSKDYDTQNPPEVEIRLAQILSTQGKRMRPAITLLASRLWGQTSNDKIIKMATAVELLHIASLIHDDTIDSADVRRGKATASNLWGGEIAVLLGDFVFATSATFVCDTENVQLIRRFAETIAELARGELNELTGAWHTETTYDTYMNRIYDKTASLFSTSAESGAVLGGADENDTAQLKNFGHNLGMAYQIFDDLLDFEATYEQIGKPVVNDLSNGILTLPAIIAFQNTKASYAIQEYFESLGNGNPRLLQNAYNAINDTGALVEARNIAKNFIQDAKHSIKSLPKTDALQSLELLLSYVSRTNS